MSEFQSIQEEIEASKNIILLGLFLIGLGAIIIAAALYGWLGFGVSVTISGLIFVGLGMYDSRIWKGR